jgi:hypothetical protein
MARREKAGAVRQCQIENHQVHLREAFEGIFGCGYGIDGRQQVDPRLRPQHSGEKLKKRELVFDDDDACIHRLLPGNWIGMCWIVGFNTAEVIQNRSGPPLDLGPMRLKWPGRNLIAPERHLIKSSHGRHRSIPWVWLFLWATIFTVGFAVVPGIFGGLKRHVGTQGSGVGTRRLPGGRFRG